VLQSDQASHASSVLSSTLHGIIPIECTRYIIGVNEVQRFEQLVHAPLDCVTLQSRCVSIQVLQQRVIHVLKHYTDKKQRPIACKVNLSHTQAEQAYVSTAFILEWHA